MERTQSVIEKMAYRYNQLYLTPKKGISETGVYSDIVCYGKISKELKKQIQTEGLSGFKGSNDDRFFSEITPAGQVDIVYLHERSDFERFIQIMAYSGEPAKVSAKIESAEIIGVTNWRKIEEHMNEYLVNGGANSSWREELRRFTENKKNYQDSLIVIGGSGCCGLTAEGAGYPAVLWDDISMKIKTYSACSRFVFRRLFSDYKNILWEEIVSDCIGIMFALNKYDTSLAKKMFGVSSKGYNRKGKLANFCIESSYSMDEMAVRVSEVINKLGTQTKKLVMSGVTDFYDVLFKLEENMNKYVDILKN